MLPLYFPAQFSGDLSRADRTISLNASMSSAAFCLRKFWLLCDLWKFRSAGKARRDLEMKRHGR